MIDWSSCNVVERDPERVSGAWVFRGSRVPVAALFENLEDGVPIGEFVDLFPGITLAQAKSILEHAARSAFETAWCRARALRSGHTGAVTKATSGPRRRHGS